MRRPVLTALLWSVGIFLACSVPGNRLPPGPFVSFDKVVHLAMFFGYGALWLRAFPKRPVMILLTAAVFAVGIEVWQSTPWIGRRMDAGDAVADLVGAVLGVSVELWRRRRGD